MKNAFRLVAGTALLVLGATLAACHTQGSSDKTAAKPMELKLYDVPAAQSDNLLQALTMAMVNKVSVSQAAPGKVLVYAPSDAQASIGKAIAALAKAPMQKAAPVQVSVHFWVIDGSAGNGEDDPALKQLVGSLASLQRTMGPLHFRLDQAAALVGTSSENGSLTTADGPYKRSFYFHIGAIEGDTARLQLIYQDEAGHGLGKLDTHIDATFGQYIVLAQAPGVCAQPSTDTSVATCPNKPAVRLLVVRVDRLPAKA